mgnify:FL=1
MDKLIITRLEDKICTATVSEGKVVQLTLEPDSGPSILQNIYIGKVQKVVPGINAAFVDIAPGVSGYYSLTENKEHHFVSGHSGKLKAGDEIAVQVSRDAVKTKAPVLTANITLTGRYCVFTSGKPGIGFSSKLKDAAWKAQMREALGGVSGIIVRTNAGGLPPEMVLQEFEQLKGLYESIRAGWSCRTCYSCLYQSEPSYIAGIRDSISGSLKEIVTDEPVFYRELKDYMEKHQREDAEKLVFYEDSLLPLKKLYSLHTALEKAMGKKVWLKSGGYLVIEPTEAMVVIDVNTGKYSGKKKMAETILRTNLEAAEEIGRQLRLRNLSGIIMVDFIDMEAAEDKQSLMHYLTEVVSKDPVKTTVVDMTGLNLVEITRKKVRKPLYEQVLS